MRIKSIAVATAGAVLAGGLSTMSAAATPTAAPAAANRCAQKVTWKNTRTGLYLDAKGAGGNHAPVITWYGNGGSNQRWCLERVAGSQYNKWYFHPSYNTRLCMDVPRYYTGAKVVLWTCNGGRNQRFEITHVGGGSFFSPDDASPSDDSYNLRAGGAGQSVTLTPMGNSNQTIWR
ncbi:RICIN domain-containing protein [Streptomyces lydicus]|uniref:RICIN domain-containing protein n=1 Tax=Streptomyces lydicus TaxID=47763 RepID=UPI0037B93CFE